VPRILFVKTSSLGDVVHNCPAVSDVARSVPGARIDWVVEEAFAEVVALHRSVERVIPLAIRRWRAAPLSGATWSEAAAFRRKLREVRYDAVVDTQGLLKSALAACCALGPRHGPDRASAREPLAARFYQHRHPVAPERHAVERNRQLAAAALGYAAGGPCDYGLAAAGAPPLEPRSPFALLLTMSSRAGKLWPEEHWRALGARLASCGVQCVLPWGDEEEQRRCRRIAAEIEGSLVPRHMGLAELARLMARARCAAGVDTGLAHLAAALGVPVVGIYTGSDPMLTGIYGAPRSRNLGAPGAPPAPEAVFEALAGSL